MKNALKTAFVIWTIGCSSAFAWGVEGHHIIARIAASELTPRASAVVTDLLGGEATASMISASTWADEIRPSRPETAPWHYVDIEIDSQGYESARDCPNDDCVVAQIERETRIVGDTSISKSIRAEALRFLIHFVGDLHQPLHCTDNHDRGGNSIKVVFNGRRTNMHGIWDTAVVEALGTSDKVLAVEFEHNITPSDRAAWGRGSVASWANETWTVGKSAIYRNLSGSGGTDAPIVLPGTYAEGQRAVVTRQMQRAGVRLAVILNQHLK